MMAEPDLIAAARDGDGAAIARLLAQAQPDIRRYARYNCRTASDVEEAVQEVLILLYRRIATLRAIGAFSGWLATMVRRTCWRLARGLTGLAVPIEDAEVAGRSATASDGELRVDLARAIEALPEHYRRIVLLRDVEELTIDEIAAAVSASREAVKARLHRARALIRDYLAA
ncbi:RNA polymerase sigma factor [Bradyrhizobium sp. U87765 SZCCT0131]|uniref:RNA polymerase sigma factor n=1 Tax=unclassified Bradyrhizobium TaxID=2631580 RepID=UPI001BA63449|nr:MULTISPECIES: RNA polymerase sigma factor [unclassified Bradyrhizobium]MBR1222281.1 RNA polymerase sigma factor [Bradyrhizobium sp. U87765 SZCCT0131]MBR1264235.1 RNA polymerase sigma factor [Bradyrhizobium sp. U87765 SZCCT0134]MBR1307982.1 RNA polymerase sigma factor [Bradyrhizobium sp. U87765 SZCCT0110]MBR1320485.1 RNA polymerase sigma factor [Bradyrhizobium sp. U87765 SZCCT0109]MBR1348402.1 RNA polymerase sigma factor [Bradyrhizobium sp. U87765 SZCCT0048]